MINNLLRSGQLADFQAIGENGLPVFEMALQLREALRLRQQQQIADCLAIPQINDDGDKIDWYSPVPGRAKSWIAADAHEREQALNALADILSAVQTLSQRSLQAENPAMHLFGKLLPLALQFPAQNHLYLVAGKPVITFWGFVNLHENIREDVLDCLRVVETPEPEEFEQTDALTASEIQEQGELETQAQESNIQEPDAEPPLTYAPPSPQPTVAPPLIEDIAVESEESNEDEDGDAAVVTLTSPRRRLWVIPALLLPVVAVSAAAWFAWNTHAASQMALQAHRHTAEIRPVRAPLVLKKTLPLMKAVVVPAEPAVPTPTTALAPAPSPAVASSTLPLDAAVIAPVSAAEKKPVAETQEKPVSTPAPAPKNALIMSEDELRVGTTRFLNGNWRAAVDFSSPVTGKPPVLRYQIKDNKGSVRLTLSGGVVCKADVYSGLHASGVLMIKSRGAARCSDSSRYPLPEISCKAGANDVAECSGAYGADTVVPVTFKKISD